MKELTTENFKSWIKRKKKAVVLFWWDYCKPCKAIEKELEKLPQNTNVGIIDVNKQLELTQKYRVVKLPCLILFNDGKEADRIIGYHSLTEIKQWLKMA